MIHTKQIKIFRQHICFAIKPNMHWQISPNAKNQGRFEAATAQKFNVLQETNEVKISPEPNKPVSKSSTS